MTGGVENRLLPLGVEDLVLRLQDARGGRPARAATLFGFFADCFWEAGKYVRRMDQRLKERPHECEYEAVAYRYGTHFVLPESMLRMALPVGLKFVMRFIFRSAKEHPDECKATRKDVDRRLSAALHEWIAA